MRQALKIARHQSGISYVEVLVAVTILAISVLPATNAIRGSMDAAESDSLATVNHYRLMSKLEEVLAEPFSAVFAEAAGPAAATAYSDTIGTIDRRVVFIAAYDGDNADADNNPFTGTDTGLLWVRVEIEGSVGALQSLMTDR